MSRCAATAIHRGTIVAGPPTRTSTTYPLCTSAIRPVITSANVVKVNYTDGEPRPSLDAPRSGGPVSEDDLVMAGSSRTPAEVGAFTGASAKRRWRLHR